MLEASDIALIRDWIIVVYFGVTAVASCIGLAFGIFFIVKVSSILNAARETIASVRGKG